MTSWVGAAFVLLILLPPAVAAQAPAPAPAPQSAPTNAPKSALTLLGCVSGSPAPTGQFTFLESDTGNQYRLTGKSLRKFAGQRVEIVGGSGSKRLSIRGGLWPSPNVAARGGDMDPAQIAIANLEAASNAARTNFPEFRVTRVREVAGACQ